jgi:PTS system nitrogen regulatory IIA component
MQLTVRDVAHLLRVDENKVYHWVTDEDLPAERVNGRYRFNRSELLEWATVHKVPLCPACFQTSNGNGDRLPSLEEAIAAGGVHHGVKGMDLPSALRAVVQRLPLPESVDREFLLQVFLNREASGSTGIGDGMALPHARYPFVLPVEQPIVAICFLDRSVPYGPRGEAVHTLLTLISPTVRGHLGMLARISSALHHEGFHNALVRRAAATEILAQARRAEEILDDFDSHDDIEEE